MQRARDLVITTSIFTGIAGLFIVLRCISRFIIIRNPGTEDWLIILSLILSIATTVDFDLQRRNGLGRHTDTVSPEQVKRVLELLFASVLTYNVALLICKGSILYQYLRFFVAVHYRQAAYGLIAFIVVGGTAFLMAIVFSCKPIAKSWTIGMPGTCIHREALWYSFSSFNLLTDFAVLILPIPVLLKIQLPRRQKLSLILVFALGGFGCIVSILRLHAIYKASISTDLTYDNVDAALWSSIELNVAIMCACIPAIRPIISAMFPKLLSSTHQRTSSNIYTGVKRQSAAYIRHDSEVELSQQGAGAGTANASRVIEVKTEWTVSQLEEGHAR